MGKYVCNTRTFAKKRAHVHSRLSPRISLPGFLASLMCDAASTQGGVLSVYDFLMDPLNIISLSFRMAELIWLNTFSLHKLENVINYYVRMGKGSRMNNNIAHVTHRERA